MNVLPAINLRENPTGVNILNAFFPHISYHKLALKSTPSKQTFYTRLAQSSDEIEQQKLDAALGRWLDALDALVVHMAGFYEREGWGDV
jgi:hypothetical protein